MCHPADQRSIQEDCGVATGHANPRPSSVEVHPFDVESPFVVRIVIPGQLEKMRATSHDPQTRWSIRYLSRRPNCNGCIRTVVASIVHYESVGEFPTNVYLFMVYLLFMIVDFSFLEIILLPAVKLRAI